jgi:hypothetical protein
MQERIRVRIVRVVLFIGVLLTGAFVAFYAQATAVSTPAYQQLFWMLILVAGGHLLLATAYFRSVRHWSRWVALGIACSVGLSFAEMAWRVWG